MEGIEDSGMYLLGEMKGALPKGENVSSIDGSVGSF